MNKLNDLTETIEAFNFYTQDDVDQVATLKLMGTNEDLPKIDSIIDAVVVRFNTELNEDEQIKCKSAIKNFIVATLTSLPSCCMRVLNGRSSMSSIPFWSRSCQS